MGGLAIRTWLHRHQTDARVLRVIAIGSPHAETWFARFSYAQNGRQVPVGSSWLSGLAASEPPLQSSLSTCFFSNCDNIVFPAPCGTLLGTESFHLPAAAHMQMAYHPDVVERVKRWKQIKPQQISKF
jgi:hypothetical protein